MREICRNTASYMCIDSILGIKHTDYQKPTIHALLNPSEQSICADTSKTKEMNTQTESSDPKDEIKLFRETLSNLSNAEKLSRSNLAESQLVKNYKKLHGTTSKCSQA